MHCHLFFLFSIFYFQALTFLHDSALCIIGQTSSSTHSLCACILRIAVINLVLVLFCFFSVGLPHRFNDVRGGPLRGERAPHLQRKHAGYKGHRGIPQTGGTEVPARCPRLVIGKGAFFSCT